MDLTIHRSTSHDLPRPRLSYDILIYTMNFLHGYIFTFMQTCRTLYDAGMPYILEDTIDISGTPKDIEPFLTFMLADLSTRGPCVHDLYIRHLGISEPETDEEEQRQEKRIFSDFARVLEHCRNIKHLTVRYAEARLAKEPGMRSALAALRGFDSLEIDLQGEHSETLLKQWADGPKYLCFSTGWDRFCRPKLVDPRPLILHFRNLRELHFLGLEFDTAFDNLEFPQLETLSTGVCPKPRIHSLVKSFPNLRSFYFRSRPVKQLQPLSDEIEQIRSLNLAAQSPGSPRWTRLEYCMGELIPLYMLGLQCPVTHLETNLSYGARYLSKVLEDTTPSRLTLEISGTGDIPGDLTKAIPSPMSLLITHLKVWVHNDEKQRSTLDSFYETFSSFLRHLSSNLTHLSIKFSHMDSGFRGIWARFEPSTLIKDIEQNVKALQYLHLQPFWKDVFYRKTDTDLEVIPGEEGKEMQNKNFPKVTSNLDRYESRWMHL